MEGKEMVLGLIDAMREKIEEQAREIERLTVMQNEWISGGVPVNAALALENDQLRKELAALKAQPSGVALPERFELEPYQTVDKVSTNYKAGFNAAIKQVRESLNQQPASGGDERAALATLERFVDTVRECYHLASSYSGCLDNVDEHGGDDHEDPICAVFHRLYYAMFDGDKALEKARAALTCRPDHIEQVRHMVPDNHTEQALAMVPVKPTQAMISAGWKVGLMGMDLEGPQSVYRAMLAAALPVREAVAEGWQLVPKSMLLEANSLEALVFVGGGITGDDGLPTYLDCVLWVGDLLDDDGKAIHGLHAYCTECEEEGSTTLAEFAAAPAPSKQGGVEK